MKIAFSKFTVPFVKPSGTSRGILYDKTSWIFKYTDFKSKKVAWGECSVIPGLSPDYQDDERYELVLEKVLGDLDRSGIEVLALRDLLLAGDYGFTEIDLNRYPSILFGLETVVYDAFYGSKAQVFDNAFYGGDLKIPINGLIWMGSQEQMKEQIDDKLAQGYSCIKMKIGAIDFEQEIQLLSYIRAAYSQEVLTLRVDANGAFSPEEAPSKLARLAALDLHSIEQPIRAGLWEQMHQLCLNGSLPIALDEELIGIYSRDEKVALLDTIQPQYIILKPSLHGGIFGCREWIELAMNRQIPFWITSALEFNIGLNAIAQFTAEYPIVTHHGLGTGSLYRSNFPSDLHCEAGYIFRK